MNATIRYFLSFIAVTACLAAKPQVVLIRVLTGHQSPTSLVSSLSTWRQTGQVANVLYLNNGKAEKSNQNAKFDSLTVVEFEDEASCNFWLTNLAPTLPKDLIIKHATALVHGEISPRDSNHSIFVINEYTPKVNQEEYNKFAQAYLKPLYEAMRSTKNLVRYTNYIEDGEIGEAKAFSLLEYRDPVAFAAIPAQKIKIRETLNKNNSGYNSYDKIKDNLRIDGGGTYATYTELPPPELLDLPSYKPEVKIVGAVRIVGSELKNAVVQLAEGFSHFHPEARVSTNFMTSSEGGLAGLYCGISDVAPMGDDAKITDQMPFFNTFGYMPTEISVATGGYEKRGSLFAWAIVVNKDNPLNEISMDQLECVFGSERTGGWVLEDNNYLYTSKYARSADSNIRTWNQLGLAGEYTNKEIETFGYCAPGFAVSVERSLFHWSHKWNGNFKEYVESKQTTNDKAGFAVASDRPLENLSNNKYAIGIAGLMHVKDYTNLKVLKVIPRSGGKAITLTPNSVATRTYPLIRDAYFYINKAPGRPLDPRAREFMRFVLSREGQQIMAKVGYYYPLKADVLNEQLKKLDQN